MNDVIFYSTFIFIKIFRIISMSGGNGSSGPSSEKRLRQILMNFKFSKSDNVVLNLNNGQSSVDFNVEQNVSGAAATLDYFLHRLIAGQSCYLCSS